MAGDVQGGGEVYGSLEDEGGYQLSLNARFVCDVRTFELMLARAVKVRRLTMSNRESEYVVFSLSRPTSKCAGFCNLLRRRRPSDDCSCLVLNGAVGMGETTVAQVITARNFRGPWGVDRAISSSIRAQVRSF